MVYDIFDLKCYLSEFEVCGYKFVREQNYNERIIDLPQPSIVTKNTITNKWVETVEEQPGIHQITYKAHWEKSENEPDSKIHKDGKLILDILLLWSIWSNICPRTGERSLYQPIYYNNDKIFDDDRKLINTIEFALTEIQDKVDAKNKKLLPALFLMQESNFTEVWEYKILFLSPCIDLISKTFSCKVNEIYSEEEVKSIECIRKDLKQFLNEKSVTEKVRDNALSPFNSKINTLGAPNAVDQLIKWVKWTLDINEVNDEEALNSHCVAFNQFRNSIVHYAGLPSRDIKIKLCNKKIIKVSRNIDEDICIRAGIYYFYVFREIIQIWIAKTFKIDFSQPFLESKEEVMKFIRFGEWREINIFEEGFEFIVENK